MDARQTFKRSHLLLLAGLLAAAAGHAANLVVDNRTVYLTGTIQSQNVNVTSSDGSALSFHFTVSYPAPQPAGLPSWLSATAVGCGTATTNCPTPNTLSLILTNDLGNYTGPFTANVTLTPDSGGGAPVTINVTFYPGVVGIPGALTVQPSASNPVSVLPIAYSSGQATLPAQQVQVLGATPYSASAGTISGGSWLLLTAGMSTGTQFPSLPASQVLTITVNAANLATLAPALYQGYVVITEQNGTLLATISVNLSLNGGTSGAVTVNPSQLTFAYSTNASQSGVPAQTLLVSTPVGSVFTATTDHPEWIVLPSEATGLVPGNLTVLVNPSAYTTQTSLLGHVEITAGTVTQEVTVQLTVTPSPVLWARTANSGGTVLFTSQGSIATPVSQKVTLVASDGSAPALSVSSSPSWAQVSLNGNTLTITPNVSGTAPALLSDQIVITAAGMANSPVSIPILMTENSGGTTGPLTINPSSLSFSALQGGTVPAAQQVTVSAPTTTGFNLTITTTNTISWLEVTPSFGGATNTTLNVSVNPSLVAPDATPYTGMISLTVPTTGQTQTIPVTLTVSPAGGGNITTDTKSLNLTAQAGTATQSGTVIVSNSVAGTAPVLFNVTTSPAGSWLSATPAQGATQSSITITANPSGLAANTYMGQVMITPLGGSPVTVNVTFTVQAQPVISATRTSYTFAYQAGGETPASQTVQISGGSFTAAVTGGSDFLSVSPGSGTNGTNLTISVNPSGQSAGPYTGVITVTGANNTVLITVTLNVTLPLPTVTSVVNGASYLSGAIAGGEVISIFGTDLGPATATTAQLNSAGNLATTLQGVQVLVNGYPAPLIYASSTQVTAVVPYEVAGFQQATVLVVYLNQRSNVTSVAVAKTSPAIFTLNAQGTGPGAHNADFSSNNAANPVAAGGYVVFFMTGEGPLAPAGVTGRVNPANGPGVAIAALPVGVLIDNQPANWTYAGGIAGVVEGIMQLNVQIPSTARSGDLPVLVTIGGNGSQSGVTVSVK
ncbi:MAG TPA: IPT/TIG domain-containing protein [Bryobacteraceae bacterium]|nr:IPT/TIG domain-containing protein [Bryobacteraceae bacterium]